MKKEPNAPASALPEILAPAGDAASFLAAVAAGADAVYLGLKHFSARMEAENFSLTELAGLAELARGQGMRTYVTLNSLLKPGDVDAAGRLLDRLARDVRPEAIIVQDAGAVNLARQTGFQGELHLSTLSNLGHPAGFAAAARLGVQRVVLPRELDMDEIKACAEACPASLSLEVFIHGALCYCISGRCWWSSFFGGKSGLRGRCVQPCRRLYGRSAKDVAPRRLFSCQDLSLDVLTKILAGIPQIKGLKIEGRKKGPHYVFYTVKAYRMLRDNPGDPEVRKTAQDLLLQALGRPATHGPILPQKPHSVVRPDTSTASGLLVGKVRKETSKNGKPVYAFSPKEKLLPGDLLRIGFEDDAAHRTLRVTKSAPKRGRYVIPPEKGLPAPNPGADIFLVDRREPELMRLISSLRSRIPAVPSVSEASSFAPAFRRRTESRERAAVVHIHDSFPRGKREGIVGLILSGKALDTAPRTRAGDVWWWLPPVIWPKDEARTVRLIEEALKRNGRTFVLGSPWQAAMFPDDGSVNLIAGPYCNLSNALAVEEMAELGCSGVFASVELPKEEMLQFIKQSPLPAGVVIHGLWPLGISRRLAEELSPETPVSSPKGELCFARKKGENYWIYPDRILDLTAFQSELRQAGATWLVHLHEPLPKGLAKNARPSTFNWNLRLL
ncbi:MAG: family peptidase [Desulfovibrionales bacterium]|nr:family peptidase [Desulfovibrionales bacterium]